MASSSSYNSFIDAYEAQLLSSGVPKKLWRSLHEKLSTTKLDAGDFMELAAYEVEEGEEFTDDRRYTVLAKSAMEADSNVFVIDHMWSAPYDSCRITLRSSPELVSRILFITRLDEKMKQNGKMSQDGNEFDFEEAVNMVMDNMFRYNETYSMVTENGRDPVPLWYMMDELGLSFHHSDDPNFRFSPFFYSGLGYSICWPINDIEEGEELTRDFLPGIKDDSQRAIRRLAWDLQRGDDAEISSLLDESEEEAEEGSTAATLKKCIAAHEHHVDELEMNGRRFSHVKTAILESSQRLPAQRSVLGKFADKEIVKIMTNDPILQATLSSDKRYVFVESIEEADVIWALSHFKQRHELKKDKSQIVNQLQRHEHMTTKHLLAKLVQNTYGSSANWFRTTFVLEEQAESAIGYFVQETRRSESSPYMIVKPWNLTRSTDIAVVNQITPLIRLMETGPKVAQSYISKPLLYEGRKFDLRIMALVSEVFLDEVNGVRGFEAFIYSNTYARIAAEPFTLTELENFGKHVSVQAYRDSSRVEFINYQQLQDHFNSFPLPIGSSESTTWEHAWVGIQKAVRELLTAGVSYGLGGENAEDLAGSFAMYGIDVMFDEDVNPYILECNFSPDATRMCKEWPQFPAQVMSLIVDGSNPGGAFTRISPQ